MLVLFQIFGHMFGKQDVPGIAAIHHPLRHVDSGAGDVGALDSHRSTSFTGPLWIPMRSWNRGMTSERLRDLDRASRRRLRAVAKDQRHAVASRQPNEFPSGQPRGTAFVPQTISFSWLSRSFCSSISSFE